MSALASVSIDWKMLTPVRPEDHLDEQIFNRCKFIAFAVRDQFYLICIVQVSRTKQADPADQARRRKTVCQSWEEGSRQSYKIAK